VWKKCVEFFLYPKILEWKIPRKEELEKVCKNQLLPFKLNKNKEGIKKLAF